MIISILQPAYLPWFVYFERIYKSDIHVMLDHVQIERNTKTSFTNRNKLRNDRECFWITVPIKYENIKTSINQVRIDNSRDWKKKHLSSFIYNYKKAPFFDNHFEWLKKFYSQNWEYLMPMLDYSLEYLISFLKIKTKIIKSSDMNITGNKNLLIINICKSLGATKYISGPFGKNYLNLDDFKKFKIEVEFQNFFHPKYSQIQKNFISNLSIFDLILNHGSRSIEIINGWLKLVS